MPATLEDILKQLSYVQATGNTIASCYGLIVTFKEAFQWKADMRATIHLLDQIKEWLAEYSSVEEQEIHKAIQARRASSFFGRYLGSGKEEKDHASNITRANKGITDADETISIMVEKTDLIPGTKAEQAQMLNELNFLKMEFATGKNSFKDLQQTISSLAEGNSPLEQGYVGNTSLDSSRLKRTLSRLEKQKDSYPHESAKLALKRQMILIEREIDRLSRFKGEDFFEDHEVIRCAYCGRRVPPGEVCFECGSSISTSEL